ncbi:MAG: hypothetical protein JSW15_10370 [Deltaproteobacteria bacterium]|nr:MAG: hypothetical protein JSW15_10370 [Deltaproteobacteria bacterium]
MKYLKIRRIIVTLLFLSVAFGCLPETRKAVVRPKTDVISPPPLSIARIDNKIAYLERILEEKQLNDEDKEIASDLLSAYKIIRSYLLDQSADTDNHKIIQLLYRNLGRLDEKYFLKEGIGKPQHSEAITAFSTKRKKIRDKYFSGDYQGVINECVELEAAFGPDSLTPEIGLLFTVSLAKKGMLEEATIVAEKIIRELEGKPGLIHLRAHIIEWQLNMGNREKALQIYEKLMDNLDEREALLERSRRMVTEKRRMAHHQKVPTEGYSSGGIKSKELGPMDEMLKDVDQLIQRHEFDEAKILLIKRRIRAQEGPEIETIDQALKTVDLAEERFQREKNAKLAHEKETLILARRLIEEENFEEAITKLEQLRDEQDMTSEMRELKEAATEKLVNRERNKAAKYFLMARKTTDPAKKEELLLSSYKILKVLIEQYPSSSLIDKLNNNIEIVKKELVKLGKAPNY